MSSRAFMDLEWKQLGDGPMHSVLAQRPADNLVPRQISWRLTIDDQNEEALYPFIESSETFTRFEEFPGTPL